MSVRVHNQVRVHYQVRCITRCNTSGSPNPNPNPHPNPNPTPTQVQYFWEAFPASASPTQRTTYLFTYMSPEEGRPSVSPSPNPHP